MVNGVAAQRNRSGHRPSCGSPGARIGGIWIVLIGILAVPATLTGAPTAAGPGRGGVDAVLVIDSSGSMKETDPRRLRVPAAKLFISLLGAGDRVGLVSFSDAGYPVVRLTPATAANRDHLLRGVDKVSAKGAYTNLHAALEAGLAMLGADGITDRPPDLERRRILVLMSDGRMDTGDFERDRTLIDRIRGETLDALAAAGVEVYTIAFTEASDMALMREIAARTAALSRLASNDRELHAAFSQIFESAKQPDMLPIHGGEFQVDTAVDEVTVVASKASPEVEIRLETPDGRTLAAAAAGEGVRWFESEQFDMITVPRPQAGRWRLLASDDRDSRAYIVTDLGMDARIGEAPVYVGSEQTAEAWLLQDGDILTANELLAQTRFRVEIVHPDGTRSEAPLADTGLSGDRAIGDGVFANHLVFTQPGQQRVRVIASGGTFEREKTVFVEAVPADVDAAQTAAPAAEAEPDAAPAAESGPAPPPAAEPAAAEPPGPGINVGLIVSLFVLVNALIAAVVGGVIFWRRRRAAKAAPAESDGD